MEYSKLISRTLSNEILADIIQKIELDSGALNLVCPDWEEKLKESPAFKRHSEGLVQFSKGHACTQEKAFVRNAIHSTDRFNIIVVGYWVYKHKDTIHTSFSSIDCPPLTTVAEAWRESNRQILHDGGRFFMEQCDPTLCRLCFDTHTKHNVPMDPNRNWCVSNLRIFDGCVIKHAFKKTLEDSLKRSGKFLAICQVCVTGRITFDERFKISGSIKNILVFQESSIQYNPKMNFLEMSLNMPSIEYPAEDASDDPIIHVK